MSRPSNREEFKDWCLRQLGAPVMDINIDDEQLDDCVDSALQFFQDYHFDATENWYVSHQITQQDKDNQYIDIDPDVIGVSRVFPIGSTNASVNMFDLRYQLRLHDLFDFTSTSYVNYTLTMQHIRTLDLLFSGEFPIRFNRHTHKLYLDMNWDSSLEVGEYLVFEGFKVVDYDVYNSLWNDRLFKALATAHVKKVWGANLKKFGGTKMLGGQLLDGQVLYNEAMNEIAGLEEKIESSMQSPPRFLVG